MEIGERVPTLDDLKVISDEFKVGPFVFFGTSDILNIQNGKYSPGIFGSNNNHNVVGVNEDLLNSLVKTLDKLTEFLDIRKG